MTITEARPSGFAFQNHPVLELKDLSVAYWQNGGWIEVVREVSLQVERGQIYGLVGESGSGKTTLALAIMRYLDLNGTVRSGKIKMNGRELLPLSIEEMRNIWGKEIALVPQDPQSSLNPSLKIGEQLVETLRRHLHLSKRDLQQRMLELLEMVHIADPERVAESYPHQISGGMQQRVMIAMALSTSPTLLILDEPTTNLDVTTQAVILDLVRELIRGQQTSAIYVSHNLGVVAQVCDRIAVMYAGELVEDGAVEELFYKPLHPYTQGLLDSVPRLGETKTRTELRSIEGQIPSLDKRPSGCVFRSRCPLAIDVCEERPPLYIPHAGRSSRCHRWEEIGDGQVSAKQPVPRQEVLEVPDDDIKPELDSVLDVDGLRVHFEVERGLAAMIRREKKRKVKAVNGVSFEIPCSATLGLVGESGSGKTTIARAVMGLVERTGGSLRLLGFSLPANLSKRDLDTLRRLQLIFQNPEQALNPYHTIGDALRRPLMTLLGKRRAEAEQDVARFLEAVRLPASFAQRLPGQLSGGELQRVAIARALAANPNLLVCDEPVSSLDVSVQSSILNLLNEIQDKKELSILFISHDLAVVSYLADVIAVLYLGSLMEVASSQALFQPPYHPYTEALLSAIPLVDPHARQEQIRLEGEIPSPIDLPSGCPFHTRCPRFLGPVCVEVTPPWRTDAKTGKHYLCHISVEDLKAVQKRPFAFSEEE